jgi:hypothetical protein
MGEFSDLLKVRKTKKPKHVMLSIANYERLRRFGVAGETINDCVTKILAKIPGVYRIDMKESEGGSDIK